MNYKGLLLVLFSLSLASALPLVHGAGCTPATPTVPSGISYYLPVCLINTQSSALPANAQINVTINAITLQPYVTKSLNNTEWFFVNGTIIPSWIEGNSLNELRNANVLYQSANVLYWLRVYNSVLLFPASMTTNTVFYLGIAGNTVTTANTLWTSTNDGVAPALANTIPGTTYGEYDDGANVFSNYQAWGNGALSGSLPSAYQNSGSPTLVYAANYLSIATASSHNYGINTISKVSLTFPLVSDYFALFSASSSFCMGYCSGITKYYGVYISAGPFIFFVIGGNPTGNDGSPISTPAVYTVITQSGGTAGSGQINYSTAVTASGGSSTSSAPRGFYAASGGPIELYWTRERIYFPNGVQPTISNTPLVTASSTTCTFTVSNSVLHFGDPAGINAGSSIATNNAILITNTGSTTANVQIDGTTWGWSSPSGDSTSNTAWDWAHGTAWASSNQLKTAQTDTKYALAGSGTVDMYFGLNIPSSTPGGSYSQNINIISSC